MRAGADEHGAGGLRRLGVPLAVGLLAIVALGWSLVGAAATVAAPRTAGGLIDRLAVALRQPVPRAALLPFRLVMGPVVATARSHGPSLCPARC